MRISRQFWISLAIVILAGAILVVVVISWNSVPGWQQVPGGPWILIGAAAVSVAAFVRNALQIVKIVSDLYKEANIEADELSEMLVEILRTLVQVARQNNTTTESCSIDSGTSSKGKYRLLIQDPSRGNDISIEELDMDPLQALVDRGYLLPVNQSAYELLSSAFEAFGHS
jgi:hypothetical protein